MLGDWLWQTKTFGFDQDWQKNEVCHKCMCTKDGAGGTPLYNDFKDDAAWQHMPRTDADWRASVVLSTACYNRHGQLV